MMGAKHETLPEILAGLKALVADLQNTSSLGDDGIPVLTTAIAVPAPAAKSPRVIGASIPTLSAVAARPEREAPLDALEEPGARGLDAPIWARAVMRRFETIWAKTGNPPLEPAMIAALERALAETLQNPT